MTTKECIEKLEAEYLYGVELISIDYRDEIEDKNHLEELAQTGYLDSIHDLFDDNWMIDAQCETISQIMQETFKGVDLTEDNEEAIKDWCYEHDTSEPTIALLKNTRNGYYYYDLNYYVEEGTMEYVNEVMEKLNIPEKYLPQIKEMVLNAVYGGRLAVLFVADPVDMYGDREEVKSIEFRDPQLVVMDRNQGSGWWSNKLEGLTMEFAFHNSNLHYDNGAPGYSFSGDVCGMDVGNTDVWSFENHEKVYDMGEDEDTKAYKEQEDMYDKAYKEGGCTFGDTKMGRHQNTPYINEFPCGWKCTKCGQFWVD